MDYAAERLDRLNSFVKSLNISRVDFARAIKMNKSTISSVLNGTRPFGDRLMRAVCAAYPQVSIDWLKFGTGRSPFGERFDMNVDTEKIGRRFAEGMAGNGHVAVFASESLTHGQEEYRIPPVNNGGAIIAELQTMISEMRLLLDHTKTLVKNASATYDYTIKMCSEIKEVYDNMHKVQQEHISKSQEWIEGQKASMGTMRESLIGIKDFIEQKIDEQTEKTEKDMLFQFEKTREECKTAVFPRNMKIS